MRRISVLTGMGRGAAAEARDEMLLAGGGLEPGLEAFLDEVRLLSAAPPPAPSGDLAVFLRDGIERSHTPAPARATRRLAVRSLAARAAAGATALVTTFGGMAAAGALPHDLQRWASGVAAAINIAIPAPDDGDSRTSQDPAQLRAPDRPLPAAVDPATLVPPQFSNRGAADSPSSASVQRRDSDDAKAREDRADADRDRARDQADAREDAADDRADAEEDAADDRADAEEDAADDRADAEDDAADDAEDAADARRDAKRDAKDDAKGDAQDADDDAVDDAEDAVDAQDDLKDAAGDPADTTDDAEAAADAAADAERTKGANTDSD